MDALEPRTKEEASLLEYLKAIRDCRMTMRKPADFKYYGAEDFLLQHGTFFTPANLPLTIRPMPIQQCFTNALRVASRTQAYHYVEGFATGVIPVHHAWLIDKDGNVADPTWASLRSGLGCAYIGVEFDLKETKATLRAGCSLLEDYRRDYPVLQGSDAFAKDAWFPRW